MFISILTLLTSLSLAGVVGLFSIIGIMTIYAGAPFHAAMVMGIVMECSKLVIISWVYRNWHHTTYLLKIPLVIVALTIMLLTNVGVFGFLSKAHLEQGASTVDNSAKVEQLNQQIARAQSSITDNEKVIAQMDGAVNSLIGKDLANRSITVRRTQASQRKQLRDDITASQAQIDTFSKEKFTLESEVRKLQLEVGPIRYIAELFHKDGDTKSIESSVQTYSLIIVLILDPAAVLLLLAANQSLLRYYREKEDKAESRSPQKQTPTRDATTDNEIISQTDKEPSVPSLQLSSGPEPTSTSTGVDVAHQVPQSVDPEIFETVKENLNEEEVHMASEDESKFSPEYSYEELIHEQSEREDIPTPTQVIVENIRINEETEISEKKTRQQDILDAKEKAIVSRFGNSGSFLYGKTASPSILQPTRTRVEEYTVGVGRNNNEKSQISDPKEVSEKIKSLSWIKVFNKE